MSSALSPPSIPQAPCVCVCVCVCVRIILMLLSLVIMKFLSHKSEMID